MLCFLCFFVSIISFEAMAIDVKKPRHLRLYNTNTKEYLVSTYLADGAYDRRELVRISVFLRDFRQNKALLADKKLLNALWVINELTTGGRGIIKINSAYRTRETNKLLQRKGYRAADNSMHIHGKAIDFSITGVSAKVVMEVAKRLRIGGVGYYPSNGFVHIDTGDIRHWSY
ncbi:Peptidase M15 [compost metagenome]